MRHDDIRKQNPEIVALKKRAKVILAEAPGLSNTQTIELAAREKGFKTYAAFLASLKP